MSFTDVTIADFGAPRLSYARAGKRVLDIILALCLVPFVVPVIGLLALLVRSAGAPAFYVHRRVGQHGRHFGCFKIRTMRLDADTALDRHLAADPDAAQEWAMSQKLQSDPRVTRIGAFLRRTSLDELPQVWNVLRGDMSLVGPRPVTPPELALYHDDLPAYLALRPGITGLWQVEARMSGCYAQRVACDRSYADRLSLLTDLWLMIRTLRVLASGTGV